jgi:uncharacterized small protein (DUF1192 family)
MCAVYREKALRDLEHELTSEPIGEGEVAELEEDVSHLTREIADLSAKREALQK